MTKLVIKYICELCKHLEEWHDYDGDDRYDCSLCPCVCGRDDFVEATVVEDEGEA